LRHSRRRRLLAACSLLLCLVRPIGATMAGQLGNAQWPKAFEYRPGVVLVKFRAWAGSLSRGRLLAAGGMEREGLIHQLGVDILGVPAGTELRAIEALARSPLVEYAEPDYVVDPMWVPDDPMWSQQWGLAAIEADAAWNLAVGGSDTVVAVVDSGIDLDHPDLSSKLWVNTGEIAANGLDDDGNDCVDDVHGCRFYSLGQDGSVQDEFGHGSHVAGIISAATNNGLGVAGVSWGGRLMAVRVLDQSGVGSYSQVAAGLTYAADQGATIANLSLGSSSASLTLQEAVEYAHARGVMLVGAAGNGGADIVFYPAAYEQVVAAAATNQADQRWSGSNRGPEVDLAAPGVEVWSASKFGTYAKKSGTSTAAPYVSGLAALVLSLQPWLTPGEVTALLEGNADDVNGADAPGWDRELGWGRVNARRTLESASQSLRLDLHATSDSLTPGTSQTQITAQLLDAHSRHAGSGAVIHFSSEPGVVLPELALTDEGVATTWLTVTEATAGEHIVITATFGSQNASLSLTVVEPTSTPTVTPSETPSPSPTATATCLATATPTEVYEILYLPVVLAG